MEKVIEAAKKAAALRGFTREAAAFLLYTDDP